MLSWRCRSSCDRGILCNSGLRNQATLRYYLWYWGSRDHRHEHHRRLSGPACKGNDMRILGLTFFLLVVAVGVAFAVLNAAPVTLNFYYFETVEVPLSLTLVVSLALGAVLGVIAGLGAIVRLKRENGKLRKEVKLAEKEVMNLRNIPIKDIR
jgi:putative membrane protein